MDENTTPSPNLLDLQWAVAQVREAIGHLRSSLDNLERAIERLGEQQGEFPSTQATAAVAEAESVWQASASVAEQAGNATEQASSLTPAAAGEPETQDEPSGQPVAQALRDEAEPVWATAAEARTAETTPAGPDTGEPAPEETAATPALAGSSNAASEHEAPEAHQPARKAKADQEDSDSEEARTSTWGQWSVPPSLREGGWPYGPERQPVGRQPSDLGAEDEPVSYEAPEGTDEYEVREQVRRAVEQLRVELGSSSRASVERSTEFLEAEPEDVMSMSHGAPLERDHPSAEQSEDVREQVRRAVLAARAELEAGRQAPDNDGTLQRDPAAPRPMNRPVSAEALDERFLQPASFVIDDPEGRVELVRVYRTLALLDCAATANLANYSSHSVTVQLDQRELPTDDAISEAIQQSFDRECTVEVTANRATIRLAGSKMRAA